jgi:FtsP/CotA-like multicopper oxidase with cupredoxin domain
MKVFNILILSTILTAGSIRAYGDVCPRFQPGSAITPPEDLYSQNGVLMVNLTYNTRIDNFGAVLYCFTNSDGAESPTLHVWPGDKLIVSLKNDLPPSPPMTVMKGMDMSVKPDFSVGNGTPCGATFATASSVNLHYHGTNTPPTCHQDEVIKTLVNSGDSFTYTLQFPQDEPPGLYWYHPHVHGIADAAVNGGATGAIVVEGIQNWNPILAGLPVQLLVLRDYPIPPTQIIGADAPNWNISLNYVPVPYPFYPPAIIRMKPLEKQFWRVVNSSADTIWDLQVLYDGVPQTVVVVGLDGVPIGTDGGNKSFNETDVYLPPATRAEFVVTGPSTGVKNAQVITQYVNTGELGDNTPERPVANIQLTSDSSKLPVMPAVSGPPPIPRFGGLRDLVPNTTRHLYFSEILHQSDTKKAAEHTKKAQKGRKSAPFNQEPTLFYITVVGQPLKLFSPYNPPAITTTHGSVEDWVIENHALEPHEFHIHQIHFLVLEVNGVPVPDPQYRDTFEVPLWTGTGDYPSVKLRMDFRGPTVGDFVYHCHILGHEDGGMMATIRVQ